MNEFQTWFLFEDQFEVSTVYIFNIESKSPRHLFYTLDTGIKLLIVQKHQTVKWSSD